jgi:cation transport regulator ChaC
MLAERLPTPDDLWIFGYGSLIWRPDFPHRERRAGWVRGWARRFWQGSVDHRGVPEAPGRVATLVPEPGAVCWGMGFRVASEQREAALGALDHRESGGFERLQLPLAFAGSGEPGVRALVYVAAPGNPNYLGPAPLPAIAQQVRRARGPSGSNAEYVLRLAGALRRLGVPDPELESLAALVADPEASCSSS